jgi:ketosteroid isomerase-like protein
MTDAYNNNDPQALAKLFTEDATLVTDTRILNGRDAILKYQSEAFKIIKFSNHKGMTDAKEFFAAGTWSHTIQMQDQKPIAMKGFWSAIILNDGTGQDVMQTWNITPAEETE